MKKNIYLLGALLFLLSSCTMWKANKWNSFEVVVEVQSLVGVVIENASIQYGPDTHIATDRDGRAKLFYTQGGLHIVLVKAKGMHTKQLKIRIPNDVGKIVVLTLKKRI